MCRLSAFLVSPDSQRDQEGSGKLAERIESMRDLRDDQEWLGETLSSGQRRRQMIRRLNRTLPPGRNRWFVSRQAARRAAQSTARRFSQRRGAPVRVHHHVYRPLGLRHYHLAAPDGRLLRVRFFYLEVSPEALQETAGGHGGRYQAARQTFLRALLNDPTQPGYIRGWIRQELNRLKRVSQARKTGQRSPGGNKRRVRGVPGFDVGHQVPGLHDPANFRVEHASTNRARPGIARRIGITRWR